MAKIDLKAITCNRTSLTTITLQSLSSFSFYRQNAAVEISVTATKMRRILSILLQVICSRAFHSQYRLYSDNYLSDYSSSKYASSLSPRYESEVSSQSTSFDKSDTDVVMKEVETILLPKLFGHSQFRPGQREVISKLLAGGQCATMPNLFAVVHTWAIMIDNLSCIFYRRKLSCYLAYRSW